MHFEIKLWSVILVFLAIPFCLVATESTGEELWYDASGEVVKRVKQMGKGSKHAGLLNVTLNICVARLQQFISNYLQVKKLGERSFLCLLNF